MKREKIVFLDKLQISEELIDKLKKQADVVLPYSSWPKEKEVLELVKDATIIVSKWVYIGEKIFQNAKNLHYVVMAMTGYQNWTDIKAARKYKVRVSNVPAFSSESVAEHAILLMLSVSRQLNLAQNTIKIGKFDPKGNAGEELKGKTLGILGYGNIGRRVGKLARAFGMKTVYINSKSSQSDLENLLRQSNVLSINIPLTPETEKLIGEKELSLLPAGAIVVNTSRGKVVDEKALIKYLKNRHLYGAGLDVFEKEPPDKNNPLFSLSNVVVTPHIAWNTRQSQERLANGVTKNIESYLQGKPVNIVS
ncbi:3-phosphoglycerate dehydrogenase [Patescibacteria group bacterium]|nr:3-phosphoglycerate dehydrogenase [Patescibacteria group bacterium]MCL5798101.1 3-phosphoglycerate dehydrogenase [Patescibacteria group bacterium]